jgi:hypothetical protein
VQLAGGHLESFALKPIGAAPARAAGAAIMGDQGDVAEGAETFGDIGDGVGYVSGFLIRNGHSISR